ncbi:hypothetical protein OROMI_008379 [Orobanche minor]
MIKPMYKSDGGITDLHVAALNGHFDCVYLLLDLHANASAVRFHYGISMDLIARGCYSRWLPLDVAKIWGHHWLEPLLEPNSDFANATFSPSNHLSLPLMSILNIARDCGLQFSAACASDGADICAVCLERACGAAAEVIFVTGDLFDCNGLKAFGINLRDNHEKYKVEV